MVKLPKRVTARFKATASQIELRGIVGEAIEEYSQVEYSQILLLEAILRISPREVAIMFKAMQNTRSRGNMFSDLLALKYGGALNPHWKKCNAFLLVLADFRNALAHWTFSALIYKTKGGAIYSMPGLHSIGDDDKKPITAPDTQNFIDDCYYVKSLLSEFRSLIDAWPLTSQDISQIQPVRPNRATLRSDPTPKEPPPPRPPSVPRLTEEQWLGKYRKEGKPLPGEGGAE